MGRRILVVSHNAGLRHSRSALLIHFGYEVKTAQSAESALNSVATGIFDLGVVGRYSLSDFVPIDKRIRNKYPDLLVLNIVDPTDHSISFASHQTDAAPASVIAAVRGILDSDTFQA